MTKIPQLIVMCGLPGAGKSTYAKQYVEEHPQTKIMSSDGIRKELYGDESIQGNPAEVFALMQKRTVEHLNQGIDVIYDATGMARSNRGEILSCTPKFVYKKCVIVWASIEECIERDQRRSRHVGPEIIDMMVRRFEAPFYDEGFDEIQIIMPEGFDRDAYEAKCLQSMDVSQDNPYHRLKVQQHCQSTYDYIKERSEDAELLCAAAFHDVGKPYTKAFIDSKGNPCETAHFYNHENVGGWMSYGLKESTVYTAWLISNHMEIMQNTKYSGKLPEFLKKDLQLLYEGDRQAH